MKPKRVLHYFWAALPRPTVLTERVVAENEVLRVQPINGLAVEREGVVS